MANSRFSYAFVEGGQNSQTYITDWNEEIPIVKVNFQILPDMTTAEAQAIVAAVGGIPETDLTNYPRRVPCPEDPKAFKPRKIRLVRKDGSSIQIVLPTFTGISTTTLNNTVIAVRDAVDAVDTDKPVVCIQLIGEEWVNLYDRLRTSTDAPTAGIRTIQRQEFVARISYQRQTLGGRIILPYSIRTDRTDRRPPSDLESYLGTVANPGANNGTDCVAYASAAPCPGKNWVQYRRYVLTRLVTADADGNTIETNELPVTTASPAQIRTCGVNLSNLASALCLGYKGESHARLHQLIAAMPVPTP